MAGTSRKNQTKVNKETIEVEGLTGFARVVKAGTKYTSTEPEYNLQIEFDPNTTEGKEAIDAITAAHEANITFEKVNRANDNLKGEDIIDYGVPLRTVDKSEVTKNGVSRNPDNFTNGRLKITAKSIFKPGIFGSLRLGDGGNSDLSGVMKHELPVGSIVKVKLCLISYFQEGDEKRKAKPVAGSSIKLQAVKILKMPERKVFEKDTSAEVLNFGKLENTETFDKFNTDFDESTGIE